MRSRLIGVLLIVAGIGFGVGFKLLVVDPAFTPRPNGNYGEMYGPVRFARPYVYAGCGAVMLAGVVMMAGKRRRSEDEGSAGVDHAARDKVA